MRPQRFSLCGFLMLLLVGITACLPTSASAVTVGAEQPEQYLPLLQSKRVALVVNHTSRVGEQHLVDFLLAEEINVIKVMAPEHGFRGKLGAGQAVIDNIDTQTGLPVVSLYGPHKKPSADMLSDVDTIVFDIQDVGARFYTYISTLHYVLEAAAERDTAVVVLDRPNPNGAYVAGPVRQPGFESFVGVDPIPLLHGMTVAELALMMRGEGWINAADELDLTTITMPGYTRTQPYALPIAPSPNLPNATAVRLYPSLCLFEATTVSVGRGTPYPFQLLGHPEIRLGDLTLTPAPTEGAPDPKLAGQELMALDLRNRAIQGFDLRPLYQVYAQFAANDTALITRPDFFDKLAGTDAIRKALQNGTDLATLKASWLPGLAAFKQQRRPYLLYPDTE